MNTAVGVGWFIASLIVLNYSGKYLGITKVLSWIFAVSSLLCLWIAYSVLYIVHSHQGFLTLHSLLVPGVLSILASIYGLAWWAVWTRKHYAKAWIVVASLTYLLVPFFTIWSHIRFSRPIRSCTGFVLATGVAGLLSLFRRIGEHDSNPRTADY